MFQINFKSTNYKSRGATERIGINRINPPCKIIHGNLVNLIHNGNGWVLPDGYNK